jgi:hypothetical protein
MGKAKKTEDRNRLVVRKTKARARVSNNAALLPGVDGRSIAARRFHDISVAIITDQGGIDRLSEARLQLSRRFAACAAMAEQIEARYARGETIDIAEHATLASTMVRIANKIGMGRAQKVVPSLQEYLNAKGEVIDEE